MTLRACARENIEALRRNAYPGRGIVIGLSPDARCYAQVYWIMGRSANSRNRIFVQEGDLVRTAPFDPSRVQDPSLIIYNCARVVRRAHIVSNGDQTDTIFEALARGGTFEEALFTRSFEPDRPNFTARIAGLTNLDDEQHAYKLCIIKSIGNDPRRCARHFFNYETAVPGVGHCVTTYRGDGSPLPEFEGEPYVVEVLDDAASTARLYWDALNADNKVALLVKFIDIQTGSAVVKIINKHPSEGP